MAFRTPRGAGWLGAGATQAYVHSDRVPAAFVQLVGLLG